MDATRDRRRPPAPGDEGFTLVEVLVSVFLLTGVLLGLALVQTKALGTVVLAEERQQATSYSNQALEKVRAATAGSGWQAALGAIGTWGATAVPLRHTDSGTVFTTKLELASPNADPLTFTAVTTWTSRNSSVPQEVRVRTQIARPSSS